MLTLDAEFQEYDRRIRPDAILLRAARDAHLDVRARLNRDKAMEPLLVADFLQGSYARHTMNDPQDKADVDIIVVTRLHEQQWRPEAVLDLFATWLEREYGTFRDGSPRVRKNGRSINLALDDVEVDLVPTSAPKEAVMLNMRSYAQETVAKAIQPTEYDDLLDPDEVFGPSVGTIGNGDWARDPLRIPDLHAQAWQDTHPLATLEFTRQANKVRDRMFLRIVRALKWWRKRVSGGPDHPKSYPVEHMVGDACPPGGFESVAEGVTLTLERLHSIYQPYYALRQKPVLRPRGLEMHGKADVLALLSIEDFRGFYEALEVAAAEARYALQLTDPHAAGRAWQKVLGEEFPVPPPGRTGGPTGGFTPRTTSAPTPSGGRFG